MTLLRGRAQSAGALVCGGSDGIMVRYNSRKTRCCLQLLSLRLKARSGIRLATYTRRPGGTPSGLKCPGKCLNSIIPSAATIAARSRTFLSSRTFPGQSYF